MLTPQTQTTSRRQSFGALYPRSLKQLHGALTTLVKGKLWLQVLIAMVLGLATGIMLGPSFHLVDSGLANAITNWLALPGKLFLALIQMVVIPLVVASIIRGLAASESLDQLRHMGLLVVIYFVATTALAICIGIALAYLFKPGDYVSSIELQSAFKVQFDPIAGADASLSLSTLPDRLLTILPSNPLTSMVESEMLQIVLFAIVVGAALVIMSPKQAKPLLELMGSIQEVCMTVVRWAMLLAPLAVFGLLTQLTSKVGLDALAGLAVYVAVVLLGLLILLLLYTGLVPLISGISPLKFLRNSRDVLLLAFSTSSSAAVMPLSIKTAEEKFHVRSSVAQFVIPVGATLNMNGTALYQGVATIFLAQIFGIDISFAGLVLVVITAVGASIGSPATPGVGIVILSIVLSSVGIPPAGIAFVLGVDRILDMSRTSVNVAGDLVATLLMNRLGRQEASHAELAALDRQASRLAEETGETVLIKPDTETPQPAP